MKYRSDSPTKGDPQNTSSASMGGAAATPTDIQSPVDLFGYSATYSTKERAAFNAKKASARAELVRVFASALAVLLVASTAFLIFSDRELKLGKLERPPSRLVASIDFSTASGDRKPASLPSLMPPPVSADLTPEITALPMKRQALAIELDSKGKMVNPFSIELDENGFEVARLAHAERTAYLKPILDNEFRSLNSLTKVKTPTSFVAATSNRPFGFSSVERTRLIQLRETAPEIKKMFQTASHQTTERLAISPIASESLNSNVVVSQSASRIQRDAYRELFWVQKAAMMASISGDSLIETRLKNTLVSWATTYQPSGQPWGDYPVFELLYGYDYVRPGMKDSDRTLVDAFFRSLVDRQFSQARAYKEYGVAHAIHTLFAVTVGTIIEDPGMQYYGVTQYHKHIANSDDLAADIYGTGELETLRILLQTAMILERSGQAAFKSAKLDSYISKLASGAQGHSVSVLTTMGTAAYFRPDLYPRIAKMASEQNRQPSRFGNSNSALLAALRKPTSVLTVAGKAK